jgi:hypothetical protein
MNFGGVEMLCINPPYAFDVCHLPTEFMLVDHLGGFNETGNNMVFGRIGGSEKMHDVTYHQIVASEYVPDNISLKFSARLQDSLNFGGFVDYRVHPSLKFGNFLCSFNGSPHVSRQLLVTIIKKFGYFDAMYSSKNFAYDNNHVSEQLQSLDLTNNEIDVYRGFFINNEDFNNTINSFGHVRYAHSENIYNLEDKLTKSFVHIVSETMATSYHPFVTEKFLYSIVTRGLFVAYAQPNWHAHIEEYYGFKLYDTIFDYRFDKIKNPVKRLVALMEMISKFSHLSIDDWNDLYLMEQDNIEYNYDHYFSKRYLNELKKYE